MPGLNRGISGLWGGSPGLWDGISGLWSGASGLVWGGGSQGPSNLAAVASINTTGDSGIWVGTPPTFTPDTAPVILTASARPGFGPTGNATTYSDFIVITRRQRTLANFPFGTGVGQTGQAQTVMYTAAYLTPTGVWCHDYIYAGENWVGAAGAVANNSTVRSPKPVCQIISQRNRLLGDTVRSCIVAGHRNARGKREIASCRARWTDEAGNVVFGPWISTPTIATDVPGEPGKVECYDTGDVNISALNNNSEIKEDWEAYPWIGSFNANPALSSVADTHLDPARTDGFSSVYHYRRSVGGLPSYQYCYLSPAAGGTLVITMATLAGNTITGTFSGTGVLAIGHYFTSGALIGRCIVGIVDANNWTFSGTPVTNATPTTYNLVGGSDTVTTGGAWSLDPAVAVLRPFLTLQSGAHFLLTSATQGFGANATLDGCEFRLSPLATPWVLVSPSTVRPENGALAVFTHDPQVSRAQCPWQMGTNFGGAFARSTVNRYAAGFGTPATPPPPCTGFRLYDMLVNRTSASGIFSGAVVAMTSSVDGSTNVLTVTATTVALGPDMVLPTTGLPANTTIVKQLSGPVGGIGGTSTWQMSANSTSAGAPAQITIRTEIRLDQCAFDGGGIVATLLNTCRASFFGGSIANPGVNSATTFAGSLNRYMIFRGVNSPGLTNATFESWATIGCNFPQIGVLLNNTNYDCSGFTIVSCNFPDPNVGVQVHSVQQPTVCNGGFIHNCFQEPVRSQTFAQAGSSVSLGIGTDGAPQQSMNHLVIHGSTLLGNNYSWRDKMAYDTDPTAVGFNGIFTLQSFIGVISESMSTKGDVFACVSAASAADPRCNATYLTGNQALLNGVGIQGCVNLTTMGLDFGQYYGREYLGLGCVAATDPTCQVHYDPQFVSDLSTRACNATGTNCSAAGAVVTIANKAGGDPFVVGQGFWWGGGNKTVISSYGTATGGNGTYNCTPTPPAGSNLSIYSLDAVAMPGGGDYRLQATSPVRNIVMYIPSAFDATGAPRGSQAGAFPVVGSTQGFNARFNLALTYDFVDLLVRRTDATGRRAARSRIGHQSGKWYAEFAVQTARLRFAGIVDSTFNQVGAGGAAGNNRVGIEANRLVFAPASSVPMGGSAQPGDIVRIAWDADAQRLWIKIGANWNNDPLADPATGVGGRSTANLGGAGYLGATLRPIVNAAVDYRLPGDVGYVLPVGFEPWT